MGFVVAAGSYAILAPVSTLSSSPSELVYTKQGGICAGRSFVYGPAVVASSTLPVLNSSNANDWRPYPLYVTADAAGQACDGVGNYVGLHRVNVSVTARDLTQPFNASDPWLAGLDVVFPFGVGGSNDRLYSYEKFLPTVAGFSVDPSGAVSMGSLDALWDPGSTHLVNVSFIITVRALAGSAHVGDHIVFGITFAFVADDSACYGACWSPFFDEAWSRSMTVDAVATSVPLTRA